MPFSFLHSIVDLLYPARCVACGSAGDFWCTTCRSSVEHLTRDPCPRCLSVEADHHVAACDGKLPFAGVIATGFYHSLPLRRMIAALKYDGTTAAAPAVEEYLHDALTAHPLPWMNDRNLSIIPMPLADARARERGFNQAEWVAERLKKASGATSPVLRSILIRRKGKMAQADLEHDAVLRGANVRGQFQAAGRVDHPVLLVDDVVTTGSTAAEAARALIMAGAPKVYLFALAVGK